MSELKACPRCSGIPYVIRAHGAKWVACRCGIQSSRYGEHINDARMISDWNRRPIEAALSKRVEELEAERDKFNAALRGLTRALEGYFGKTRETFFEDADCDSGELYFAAEYNAAREALKGGE